MDRFLSEGDLKSLPRWGAVALAARCVRRACTAMRKRKPTLPVEYWNTLDATLTLAEKSASEGRADEDIRPAINKARGVVTYSLDDAELDAASRKIAEAAASAAVSAEYLARDSVEQALGTAAIVCSDAHEVAVQLGAADVQQGIEQDWRFILHATQAEKWRLDKTIPREFFPPLPQSPAGPPPGSKVK